MIHRLASSTPLRPSLAAAGRRVHPLRREICCRLSSSVGLALSGSTLILYALTFVVVSRHYREYPPHYDSVGIFAGLFDLINQVHHDGVMAVITGSFGSGASWLHPVYALALAWAPIKAPEWLVSLNFVLLLAAQSAIVLYGQTFGFSRLQQIVAASLPLVPGAFYAWDGGLQDLRRDIQLVLLAIAILFTALAYVTAPSARRGVSLGLLVGLAQWSRDNAASIIVIAALPGIVLAIARSRRSGGLPWLVRLAILPVCTFLLVAMPYYAITLPLTIERYRTTVWGVGEDRIESLLAFWNTPLSVLFGGDSRLNGRLRVAVSTLMLVVGAAVAMRVLCRSSAVSIKVGRLREPRYALLLASGVWVAGAVVLYNTLLLGYGARWHAVPFLPIGIGLVAIMVGLTGALRREPVGSSRVVPLVVALGCAILVASAPVRMLLNEQPAVGTDSVNALRVAAFNIADRAGDRSVAFLTFDTLSRHHAAYYTAQADRPTPTPFEWVAGWNGDTIDLDQPIRSGDQPAQLQHHLDEALRNWADFALVYADTSRYADPRTQLWPYQLGKPIVDGLLGDPTWRPVARFTLRERDLVLLENTARQATQATRSEWSMTAGSVAHRSDR